ncbi:hypothetical protein C8R44DRAFT_782366 [Mycena epipterygia]|nr:hypothetical protein C8R44DRAFT_782366 [Mycena epipterygia]
MDGCPVVELSDSVEDVEHLPRALYNPVLFNQKSLTFSYIASFVRLGRKYDFKDLLDIAVDCLTFENPTSLVKYEPSLKPHETTRIIYHAGQTPAFISICWHWQEKPSC